MRRKRSLREVWGEMRMLWHLLITLLVLSFVTAFVHEAGHVLVCVGSGFDYDFTVTALFLSVHCSGAPQPIELYWAFGGSLAVMACLALLVSGKIRSNKGVMIGVVVTGFYQFLNALFETLNHQIYLSNLSVHLLMAVPCAFLMVALLRKYGFRLKAS